MKSYESVRVRRWSLLALSALTAGAVALPVSSASAAARPMTLLIDSSVNTPIGSFPGVWSGAKSAAKNINKAKKLKINIVTCNSHATAAGAQACTKQAVDLKATALLGSDPFLGLGFGVSTLDAAGIPFSLFTSGAADYDGSRATEFPVSGGAFAAFLGEGTLAKKAGGKKLGIVCTAVPGFDKVCENIKRIAAKQGVTTVAETSVSLTSTTFSTQAQALKSAGADVVALATPGQFAAGVVQAATSLGYKPKWLQARAAFPDPKAYETFTKATGNNLWLGASIPPITSVKNYPGLKQYAAQNRGIKAINQDESSISTWAAVYGYAQIAQKYIKGDITAAKMLVALKKAKNIRIGNGLVIWSPGKTGRAPYPRLTSDLIYYGQVKGGKWNVVKKPTSATAGATNLVK